MGWPQFVIVALLAFSSLSATVGWIRNPKYTNSDIVLSISLLILLSAGYVYTLAAGGFW